MAFSCRRVLGLLLPMPAPQLWAHPGFSFPLYTYPPSLSSCPCNVYGDQASKHQERFLFRWNRVGDGELDYLRKMNGLFASSLITSLVLAYTLNAVHMVFLLQMQSHPTLKSSLLPIIITQISICRAQSSPKPRHIKNCLFVCIPCAKKPHEL